MVLKPVVIVVKIIIKLVVAKNKQHQSQKKKEGHCPSFALFGNNFL